MSDDGIRVQIDVPMALLQLPGEEALLALQEAFYGAQAQAYAHLLEKQREANAESDWPPLCAGVAAPRSGRAVAILVMAQLRAEGFNIKGSRPIAAPTSVDLSWEVLLHRKDGMEVLGLGYDVVTALFQALQQVRYAAMQQNLKPLVTLH